ncbi:EamA family transporter, partial [uncultured Desulfovibrio sp.]
MSARARGYILAALAAAFYGTNPIFAVPLYGTGMNPVSVLLFRYLLGIPLLAAIVIFRSERLLPRAREVFPVALLGIIMGMSSLTLYEAYTCMDAGVASTLLFMYPILTSLLMSLFFHEKFRLSTGICLLMMGAGLYLLMDPAQQDAGIG